MDSSIDEVVATAVPKALVRWNLHAPYQPIDYAAWREISPLAYIYTTEDMLVPIHYQRNIVECVEEEGIKVQTFKLKTGHCPQVSDPQGVVDIVTQVVSGLKRVETGSFIHWCILKSHSDLSKWPLHPPQ